jgi:hypothetical protein
MRRNGLPAISNSSALLLLMLLTCGSSVAEAGDRVKSPQTTSKGAVNRSIKRIITETLKEGEGVVNGVKVWRRVPPAQKNIEEIRRYGDEAVAVLTNYLSAESDPERALVVEFLGLLGGSRVLVPLKNVVEKDRSPTLRILALRWLSQVPSNLALPIIRKAARTDVDENVRKAARRILDPSIIEEVPGSSAPFKAVPQ